MLRKLPNHDKMPQALRHADPTYDPTAPNPKEELFFPLSAQVHYRGSTDEWVLALVGTINDTSIHVVHTAPKALSPEDVPGLPHLYASPSPPVDLVAKVTEIALRRAAELDILSDVLRALNAEDDALLLEPTA